MTSSRLFLTALLGAILMTATACNDSKAENAAEKAGDKLEEGAEKTGDAIEKGAEKTGEAAEKAGDKAKDATD